MGRIARNLTGSGWHITNRQGRRVTKYLNCRYHIDCDEFCSYSKTICSKYNNCKFFIPNDRSLKILKIEDTQDNKPNLVNKATNKLIETKKVIKIKKYIKYLFQVDQPIIHQKYGKGYVKLYEEKYVTI